MRLEAISAAFGLRFQGLSEENRALIESELGHG
jgi:hypothetical protein